MEDNTGDSKQNTANQETVHETQQPSKEWVTVPQRSFGKRDYVWPFILIFSGAILLLNTSGLAPWSVWGVLFRFWPVLIIIAGLRMMLDGFVLTQFLSQAIIVLLILFVCIGALTAVEAPVLDSFDVSLPGWFTDIFTNTREQKTAQLTVQAADYSKVKQMDLGIDLGMGSLTLNDVKKGEYVSLDATYYDDWGEPVLTEKQVSDVLSVDFAQSSGHNVFGFQADSPNYTITLGQPQTTTNVDMSIGAGSGSLDFEQTHVGTFKADVGAGKLTVTFAEKAVPTGIVQVHIGAGSTEINLPDNVGYLLDYSVGAGSVTTDSGSVGGLGSENTNYTSSNYDDAEVTVTIHAEVGAGKLIIN